MRKRYLVCYDVRDEKRLRRVHQKMLGYGGPLQYSVFLCDLSGAELVLMEKAVLEVADPQEDSVIVVDLGPSESTARRRIKLLGRGTVPEPPRAVVV